MDNTWDRALSLILKRLTRPERETRTAVVGLGQALNGDDGAGLAVARLLQARVSNSAPQSHRKSLSTSQRGASQSENRLSRPSPAEEPAPQLFPVLVLQAGSTPENSTALLRRFRPDLVLFVDAAEMGQLPGAVSLLEGEELEGFGGSTHTFSLTIIAQYLELELGCVVALVGIQPADTGFAPYPSAGPRPSAHESPLHLSPQVSAAVVRVADKLAQILALE